MIHRLTLGHLDPAAVTRDGGAVVIKHLDMFAVRRHLGELGRVNAHGKWTLGDDDVRFHDGDVVVPWKGGSRNLAAEEFVLRLQRVTGCLIADREHGQVVEPEQLSGLKTAAVGDSETRTR